MDPQVAPLGMLPLGLANALMEDPAARSAFAQLSPARQNRLIAAVRRASSPQELDQLLKGLGSPRR